MKLSLLALFAAVALADTESQSSEPCVNDTPHCLEFNEECVCLICPAGFLYNVTLLESGESQIACVQCPAGQWSTGRPGETKCVPIPQHCIKMNGDYAYTAKCLWCPENYANYGDHCEPCADKHLYNDGFHNACYELPANCEKGIYYDSTYCTKCAPGFGLSSKKTIFDYDGEGNTAIAYSSCAECSGSKYSHGDTACVHGPARCKVFMNDTYGCKECNPGFRLGSDNLCSTTSNGEVAAIVILCVVGAAIIAAVVLLILKKKK